MRHALNTMTQQPVVSPAVEKNTELFFIIAPPRHVLSDVSVLKDDVHYLIGHKFADQHSKAHIPLFRYKDKYNREMIRFVESKAQEFEPFNVLLKDFGVFYNGTKRTIYMDIVYKYPIQEIFEKIVKEDPNYVPHITIARNLDNDDFLRCWPYLKTLNYGNQHFLCDRITVLAKQENKWVHYKDIMFGE
ncbi:MAG TPA: 2'-5' RNA ligase family protein [Ohtaekwangia sp.]|nr:2'-5' RNA ligase family protein [Ohtaekwangia sp.]